MHVEKMDSPRGQADAYCDLAQVLEAADRHDEAAVAFQASTRAATNASRSSRSPAAPATTTSPTLQAPTA